MDTYLTPSQAYLGTLEKVWNDADQQTAPRGQPIRELIDYQFEVQQPSDSPIVTGVPERDAAIKAYYRKEQEFYRSRSLSADVAGRASRFWLKLANPDGTINSNYGFLINEEASCGDLRLEAMAGQTVKPRMRTPFEWAYQALLADVDTRQATVQVALPRHRWIGNKDQVCTLHLHFRIVRPKLSPVSADSDQLDMTVVMRSNDVIKGLTYDMPYFMSLQKHMVWLLRMGGRCEVTRGAAHADFVQYPNLKVGHYRHFAHSMHAYLRDRAIVEQILSGPRIKESV